MSTEDQVTTGEPKGIIGAVRGIIKELTQPFIDLTRSSRAMLGLNLVYVFEGLCYFGILTLLAIFLNGEGLSDKAASWTVGFLTGGITLAMLLLGGTVDRIGLRKSLLIALFFMLTGRVFVTVSPFFGGGSFIVILLGLVGIIIGYGIFQPACYAGVKQLTNEKTAAMGYAMLYALMNLGGFLPAFISPPVRKNFGISGVFWVYIGITILSIIIAYTVITKKAISKAEEEAKEGEVQQPEEVRKVQAQSFIDKVVSYLKQFPITDSRFMFFIFILIPVQTLFAHNWLTLPMYTSRAFGGFVLENFEVFVNLNPILIFILTPIIAALTSKKSAYQMTIIGTFIMGAAPFILMFGATIPTLLSYITVLTIGEALWQPRFLQWVAEIAPKNKTGIYMGLGQLPWFLTKVLTSLYAGWFLMEYCPSGVQPTQMHTEIMWGIYGLIAIITPIGLILARKWMLAGFKTKHAG